MKNGLFKKWLAAVLCVLALGSTAALAEPDTFYLGDGHNGPFAPTIAGQVINSYARVTEDLVPGTMTFTVDTCSATGCFSKNDLVMVLQTTGYTPIPVTSGGTDGDLRTNAVGRWELARVDVVSGTTVTLTAPLVNDYPANVTQVIRVPEYTSVTIDSGKGLASMPWNGSTGGVLAFLATGTLTNNGIIRVDRQGFRGAAPIYDPSGQGGCSALDEEKAPDGSLTGARKGEGLFPTRYVEGATGRGNLMHAGGGGVCYLAGGGGGGNGSAGGRGGNSSDGNRAVGGMGGVALQYTLLNRLTLGGGGGGGHGDSGTGQPGGAGGGAIFIRAFKLTGTGSISATGGLGGTADYDSGAGGGAGGSIHLRLADAASCVVAGISANGGIGGSTNSPSAMGPGGGGGGGRLLLQASGNSCTLSYKGSGPGFSQATGDSYGATSGGPVGFFEQPGYDSSTSTPYGYVEPKLTQPASGASTNNTQPDIKGVVQPNGWAIIYVDGVQVGRALANGTGAFAFTLPTALSEKAHTVQVATAFDVDALSLKFVESTRSKVNTFTVDLTPPPAPVVSTPKSGDVLDTGSPTITGTAEANSTVTVYIDGSVAGTVTADASGNWSYTPSTPLKDAVHTVKATAKDAAGNVSVDSNTNTFTVDTTAPVAPTVTAPAEGSHFKNPQPAITGTAEANSTVTVILNGTAQGTVKADASGNWSYTPATALPDGDYAVKATSKDTAGNVSPESNVRNFTVDTVPPPAPVVQTPVTGSVLSDPRPAFTGTAEKNSTLTLTLDGPGGISLVVLPVDATGNWSYTPTSDLLDGTYTVKATATDKAGNTSVDSNTNTFIIDTVKPVAPTVSAPAEGAHLSETQPVITGTAEANSTVTVILNGTAQGTVTADASGNWSYTPATALPDGDYAVKATSKDAAGNVSPESNVRNFTVDTLPPPAPVVQVPATGSVVNTHRPAITGTAEKNSTVTVYIDGAVAGTTTADGSGNWSFTPTADLPDGSYKVKATSTDAAGNVSVDSNQNTFTVDTVKPVAPTVEAPGEGALLITATPLITGTAESGSTVTVYIDGEGVGTVTADGSGNWSYTPAAPLADGEHQVKATSTDAAGNTSPSSDVRTFSVDTAVPDTSITAAPSSLTHSSNAAFEFGSTETGVSYECRLDGAAAFTACAASETFTGLADGTHTLEVRARDTAGNVDPTPASYSWTVDTTAPTAPVVTAPAATVDTLTPVISGTAEPGSTVTLTLDGTVVGTVKADASGNWSYTPATPLAVGSHDVVASATDDAGNTSPASPSHPFTIVQDTKAPETTLTSGPSGTTTEHGATFELGSDEPGVTYECSLDGAPFTPCTSPVSFTDLGEGEHTFQVRARDAAGNVDATPASRTWTIAPESSGNGGGDIAFLGDGIGCSATGGDSSLVLMGLGTFLALARRRRR